MGRRIRIGSVLTRLTKFSVQFDRMPQSGTCGEVSSWACSGPAVFRGSGYCDLRGMRCKDNLGKFVRNLTDAPAVISEDESALNRLIKMVKERELANGKV